ncbi:Translation machinery-associated protein 46 [Savitreella phatthalungensis]
MAPKGMQQEKKSSKVKPDKTFGLKNKNKSAKVQAHVAQVKQQEAAAGNPKEKKAAEQRKAALSAKKQAEAAKKEELNALFNTMQPVQKVPFGVDPKTVLCAYYKAGRCEKGNRCKFSHNLEADRKSAKKDLYTDVRDKDGSLDKANDLMENWDEEKLRKVVLSKSGNPKTTTEIVCKYFLEAVESRKYGWFWICPNNGDDCQYRHSLPPGFVLKNKDDKKKDKESEVSLEEFLEVERHKITGIRTPVTLDSFNKWKSERVKRKEEASSEDAKHKEQQRRANKLTGLSGREVFTFKPELLLEDYEDDGEDEEFDLAQYRRHDTESSDESEQEDVCGSDSAIAKSDDEPCHNSTETERV